MVKHTSHGQDVSRGSYKVDTEEAAVTVAVISVSKSRETMRWVRIPGDIYILGPTLYLAPTLSR